MLGSNVLLGLFGLIAALMCAASPLAAPIGAEARTWPDVSGLRKLKRGLSNAERLQRGLAPLHPSRLYDPSRVHSAPKARLSGGSVAPPGDTINDGYSFYNCYPNINPATTYHSLTATSDQDAVNQCAAYAKTASTGRFSLYWNLGSSYTCGVGATGSGDSETCTTYDYAVYMLPP